MDDSSSSTRRRRFAAAPAPEAVAERPEALTLRMIYAPVLSYVVLFQRSAASSGLSGEKFRQEVRALLDRAGQQALRAGYPPDKVDHVRFSTVAFIDEVVRTSAWQARDAWIPLQYEEFQTQEAGDLFFDRMEGGPGVDEETAEIDYLILSLGFQGRYGGNEQELLTLRRRLFKKFPAEAVVSVSQLTPEAYDHGVHGLEEASARLRIWKWVAAGGVLAVAAVIWLILQLTLDGPVRAFTGALGSLTR